MGKIQAKPTRKRGPFLIAQQLPAINVKELIRQQRIKPFDVEAWKAKCEQASDDDPFEGFIEWREQMKAESRARPLKDKFA